MKCKVKEFDVYVPKRIVLRDGKIINRYNLDSIIACYMSDTVYSQERVIDLKEYENNI